MDRLKYVAQGFFEDVEKFLNDFADKKSVEFSVFSSLWKEHYFSLLFMGRPDDIELTEFTNELFRITTRYLSSSARLFKVGAVYLLYALYRNQISDPPIKIRIELRNLKIIDDIRKEATVKKNRTLHYVIDFLINEAFVYVAYEMLKGPMIATIRKEPKNFNALSNIKTTYKTDITEYMSTNNLEELHGLHSQYVAIKKELDEDIKLNRDVDSNMYSNFRHELENIFYSNKVRSCRKKSKVENKATENIGSRRAKIKAASFTRKPIDFWGRNAEDDDIDEEEDSDADDPKPQPTKKIIKRRKRIPKEERRVGRPRRNAKKEPCESEEPCEEKSDYDVNICSLLGEQENFFLPSADQANRRVRAVRFHYYKVSPRHDDDDNPHEDHLGFEDSKNMTPM